MRPVWIMVVSDLKQRLRDGSVIIFGVLVPFALIAVMNLIFSGVSEAELKPVTVAVAVPDGDELAAVIPQVLGQIGGEGLDVTVQEVPAQEVEELVTGGEVGLGVLVPDGFAAAVTSGAGVDVTVIRGEDVGLEATVVTSVVDGLLTQIHAGSEAAAAALTLGASPADLGAIAQSVAGAGPSISWQEGQAANFQLSPEASVVAGQAGMFLLFTVGFGVLALSIERETGTLARLMSMPIRSWSVVAAKAAVSFLLGIASTTVLLTVGWLMFDNVDFGALWKVGMLLVLVVAATTSLMFVVVKIAKTAEQASIAQSILAISLGMSGGAFFQVTSSGVIGQILQVNPVAAFTRGLGITSGGGSLADMAAPITALAVFTVVVMAIAAVLPDRKGAL